MKKFLKVLFWSVLILILIAVVGIFIFIKTFDLNTYKKYAENLVYQHTGRTLALNGDAGLKISLIPTVVLNDISLSNPQWTQQKDMIRAQKAEVSFAVLPLLKKEIVIDSINLQKPEVYLETAADGKNSWSFAQEADKVEPKDLAVAAKSDSAPDAENILFAGIVAKSLTIEDGIVVYADRKTNRQQKVEIKTFDLTSDGMDADLNLKFDLLYNGEKISGTAQTGSINAVLKNMPDYPVKAAVKAFGASADVDLVLNNLMSDISYKGNVQAVNPAGNYGAPAVKLETALDGNQRQATAENLVLEVSGNVLTGSINAAWNKAKPEISGQLKTQRFDVNSLLQTPVKTALSFNLIAQASAAEFVPDTPLDLSVLNALNARLNLKAAELILPEDIVLNNVEVTADLNNGRLRLDPISARAGGGVVSGSISAAVTNNITVNLKGTDVILQDVWKPLAVNDNNTFGIAGGGKTAFSVNVSSQGASVRQIVENLKGRVAVVVGESQIQTGQLKILRGNFVTQLLSALKLQRVSKNMDMTCAVVRSDIANGKAVFPKGIVFNAKQLTVVSSGTLNLQNDKLDFSIRPFNGKLADTNVAQAISSLIKITGTVQKPGIGIDNSAVIKNVVGMAAAGPAFLGSQVLLDVDESPCYTALENTPYQNMFPAPSGIKATGQGVYQGAADLVTDGVNALTNTVTDTAKDVLNLFKRK